MSSDSTSSEVKYTSISSHRDLLAWDVDFFRLQEPDSSEAAPASPDYVPGPKEPEQAPLLLDYVLGPEYPEYLAPSDEEVPMEDQPYVVTDSLIALSPGYVADSDPEEDSEDSPVDYPTDGGDGDDDDSSDDDEEEEASEEEEAEEEEEEHLALDDSVVAPIAPMPFTSEEEVERLLALPPPPPSPLISLSPPSAEEPLARCLAAPALPSSPLPIVPHPYGSPNHIPSPPLPPPPSSLHLPPHVPTSLPLPSSPLLPLPALLFILAPVDHREDTPEAELPPHKRLCLTALTSRYEVGESSTAAPRLVGDTWVDPREAAKEIAPVTLEGVNTKTWIFQSVETLIDDRQYHYETGHLATTLDEIGALQARDQARTDAPEGTASMAVGLVFSFLVSDNHNNMPPRRSSATTRVVVAAARAAAATAAAAAPMTAAAVE
ncbi:hypothetical protein Tco_0856221 [Tanacetum coccineum]